MNFTDACELIQRLGMKTAKLELLKRRLRETNLEISKLEVELVDLQKRSADAALIIGSADITTRPLCEHVDEHFNETTRCLEPAVMGGRCKMHMAGSGG